MHEFLILLAQTEITVSPQTLLLGYGPLGAAVWWLSRMVEKQRRDHEKQQNAFVAAVKEHSHKISGMSIALIFNAATYGPENIRALANLELQKRGAMPPTFNGDR